MKLDRWFHVLVVMGGAAACDTSTDDVRRDVPDATPATDAGPADDATTSQGDAGDDLLPCFCDQQACCDRSHAPAVVAPGFTCCWSTTCP